MQGAGYVKSKHLLNLKLLKTCSLTKMTNKLVTSLPAVLHVTSQNSKFTHCGTNNRISYLILYNEVSCLAWFLISKIITIGAITTFEDIEVMSSELFYILQSAM